MLSFCHKNETSGTQSEAPSQPAQPKSNSCMLRMPMFLMMDLKNFFPQMNINAVIDDQYSVE